MYAYSGKHLEKMRPNKAHLLWEGLALSSPDSLSGLGLTVLTLTSSTPSGAARQETSWKGPHMPPLRLTIVDLDTGVNYYPAHPWWFPSGISQWVQSLVEEELPDFEVIFTRSWEVDCTAFQRSTPLLSKGETRTTLRRLYMTFRRQFDLPVTGLLLSLLHIAWIPPLWRLYDGLTSACERWIKGMATD